MKRIVIALAAAVVLLCGCTKMPTSEYCLSKCFVTDATITVGETEYGAALSRFADGYWLVELTSPAAVKGLIFTVSGENTEVSFDGLKFTTGLPPKRSRSSTATSSASLRARLTAKAIP